MNKKIILVACLFIFYNCNNLDKKTYNNIEINNSRNNAITNAINSISSNVVGVNVSYFKRESLSPFNNPLWDAFFPYSKKHKIDNFGSGLLISSDGYIVTNSHVVDGSDAIVVTLRGGERLNAVLKGQDELTDIALIKIEKTELSNVRIGDSDDLVIGEWVIALGNPLGLFDLSNQPTATAGIISGTSIDFGLKESGRVYKNMIQTDASINPGNSGGPLVNGNGEVIGINTFIMTNSNYSTGSIGLGFAIPINSVMEIVEDLIKYGKVERSYNTGIRVQKVDKYIQKYLNLDSTQGVIIIDIEKQSSGEKAMLKIMDVIVAVDSRLINKPSDISKVIDESLKKTGDKIILSIIRNNKKMEVLLKLENNQ